jgi:hypothetical protein
MITAAAAAAAAGRHKSIAAKIDPCIMLHYLDEDVSLQQQHVMAIND